MENQMMIKSGFVPDTLEDYDEFDDLVWADRDTESVWMKHDVIYGDLEDMVLDDIYETYPNIKSEDWCGRIDMFWEDKLDDTGSSQ
jgi:hypothetical protein